MHSAIAAVRHFQASIAAVALRGMTWLWDLDGWWQTGGLHAVCKRLLIKILIGGKHGAGLCPKWTLPE
jgi:hypothetical protein